MKKHRLFFAFAVLAACTSQDEAVVPTTDPDLPIATVTVPDLSDDVTEAVVRDVAARFGAGRMTRGGERAIASVHTLRSEAGDPLCHVVNYADDGGFVVVSATKDYMPVLAFSESGSFDVEAIDRTGVSVWLSEQQVAIEHAAELPDSIRLRHRALWADYGARQEPRVAPGTRTIDDRIAQMSSSGSRWQAEGYTVYRLSDYKDSFEFQALPAEVREKLLNLPYGYANPNYGGVYAVSFVLKKDVSISSKGPFTTTQWHQGSRDAQEQIFTYNQYLPSGVLVGCVPVAVGQIMRYYRYPTTYNWGDMPNTYATSATSQFLKSVGERIGINYNSGDSGANIDQALSALKSYGYTGAIKCDHNKLKVMSELDNNRLVYMRGQDSKHNSGHAWVCDGYYGGNNCYELKLMTLEDCPSSYEPQQFLNPYNHTEIVSYTPARFHMNWGWGGTNDGYYLDDIITVTQEKVDYNFTASRQDIINIYPNN